MKRDAREFLWDIEQAASAISRFVEGMDSPAYSRSDVVRSAVERKFEIIGEALAQLAEIDPALVSRIPRFREMIGFRNLLIHGYAAVEHHRVFRVIEGISSSAAGRRGGAAIGIGEPVRPSGPVGRL